MRQRVYEQQQWFAGNEEIFDGMLYRGEAKPSSVILDGGMISIDALIDDQPMLCIGQFYPSDAAAQALAGELQAQTEAVFYGRYFARGPQGYPRTHEHLRLHRVDVGGKSYICREESVRSNN